MESFDHIILGTGQATGTLLGRLIPSGDTIAVIEGNKVGGSCVNYGCTPTKTMVASARAIHMARRGDVYGFTTGSVSVDYGRVRERMNEIRNGASNGLEQWMEGSENVELIKGWGQFTGPKTIKAGGRQIKGDHIYINTGTRPFAPPIDGLDSVPWMDSERLLAMEELPEHLLIIGGGYIGVEFSQVYRRFGCDVTIIQRGDQLMPSEDRDVAESIREILEDEGVTVHCNSEASSVSGKDGNIELKLSSGDTLNGSHLLIAAGRRPNSDKINAEAAQLEMDQRGYIQVDDYCRTGTEGVFAVGDVNGEGAFTHTSVNDAEIVLDVLNGGDRAISQRNVIYGLFTDPPLGRVGMTEKEALEYGYNVLKATRQMSKISRAKEMGETKGFAKLLVDADTDLVLGASVLGPGGDEIINMFAAIMHSQIPCREYRKVVLVHPTVSELMPWVLDGLKPVET
ncbi:MAG: FAD-dependent oxidoreductase [Bacteroidetes bacterium]|jgi:pyruvate/2-oxoglutarate dehydrogenase complex dihydrolipoamide dehydrogenase (E3) component|nr:FAD-dependent oxidoreductase [Bacteroidota bacterium]